MTEKTRRFTDAALGVLTAVFILLWFRKSIPFLSRSSLSPLFPFLGIFGIAVWRLVIRLQAGRPRKNRYFNRSAIIVLLLVGLALAVRMPFLCHAFGLMSSDDAVPALMAKHISEGKTPPVYYYGQLYMGSVSEHVQAVFFKLFGFSIFGFKLSIFLFYLGFIYVQFRLVESVFSRGFAAACVLFYSLPIGATVSLSLDTTGAFPLVMLLSALILLLTHRIAWEKRHGLVFWLGLAMGGAFWTHQITVAVILTSLAVLLARSRMRPLRWLRLALGAALGALPVILMELRWGFPLVRFLLPDSGQVSDPGKLERAVRLLTRLLTPLDGPIFLIPTIIVVAAGLGLAGIAVRRRRLGPDIVFVLFFAVFMLLYLFSGFSRQEALRYLYPLYLVIPVLLLLPFRLLRPAFRTSAALGVVLVLFAAGGLSGYLKGVRQVRARDAELRGTVAELTATGARHWQSDYWNAYLLTALSAERVIVHPTDFDRYFPYRLEYHNHEEGDNLIFRASRAAPGGSAAGLIDLLRFLDVDARIQVRHGYILVRGIAGPVFPRLLRAAVPDRIPVFDLEETRGGGGFVTARFRSAGGGVADGFGFNAEIPNYSRAVRRLPAGGEDVLMRLPGPETDDVEIMTWLDFEGLPIPSTRRRIKLSVSPGSPGRRPVPLQGFGTNIDWEGKRARVMTKSAVFRIGRLVSGSRVRINLISPFDFADPYWYGDYEQAVSISLDGKSVLDQTLKNGLQRIEFEAPDSGERNRPRLLRLDFKYHMPFDFAPLWKTAALLESIQIE